ncbi:MAG: hypothetical protein CMJ76_07505 [Planctomycetaceae bacterium]|nr:hypothetical protein [Planctomycetaceae bacterium]
MPVSRADTEAICPGCHAQLRVPPALAADESGSLAVPPVLSQPPEIESPPVVSATDESLQAVELLTVDDDGLLSNDEDSDSTVSAGTAAAQREILKDRRRKVEVSSKVFDDLADRVSEDSIADSQMLVNRRSHGQLGVSRSNLYLFAVLILFVSITSFWLGTMMNPGPPQQLENVLAGADEYVNFEGRVTFRSDDDPEAIDAIALVILLPEDSLPSEKFVENGIAAGIEIDDTLPSVQEIRRLGGDITTANSQGRFAMKVASGHRYYLLVVSALKSVDEAPRDQDLKELANYFGSPARLLDGKFYRWSLEVVNTNRDIRVYHR